MCIQYWPPSKGKMESYEGIEISYSHEEQLANFVIRNFNVRRRTPVNRSHLYQWPSSSPKVSDTSPKVVPKEPRSTKYCKWVETMWLDAEDRGVGGEGGVAVPLHRVAAAQLRLQQRRRRVPASGPHLAQEQPP